MCNINKHSLLYLARLLCSRLPLSLRLCRGVSTIYYLLSRTLQCRCTLAAVLCVLAAGCCSVTTLLLLWPRSAPAPGTTLSHELRRCRTEDRNTIIYYYLLLHITVSPIPAIHGRGFAVIALSLPPCCRPPLSQCLTRCLVSPE